MNTPTSRRDFIKQATLAIASIGAVSNSALSTAFAASQNKTLTVPEGINHISPYEYSVFEKLVDVLLPVDGMPLPNPKELPVIQTLDAALLAGMATHILAGLKGGVLFFDEGAKSAFSNRRFTELSDEEGRQFCDLWIGSDNPQQRGITMALKKLIGLSYWSNPATWGTIGYHGPIVKKLGMVSQGNTPLPTSHAS